MDTTIISVTKPELAAIFRIVPNITDDWSIYEVATKDTPKTWEAIFERAKPELKLLSKVVGDKEVECGMKSLPPRDLIFEAFHRTRLEDVKVVIIGQDPYYNGTATGMAFSMDRTRRASPSLRTVYREIQRSVSDFVAPSHGDLTEWTQQGVLLLNKALTVKPGKPSKGNDHIGAWGGFLRKVIEDICKYHRGIVFMMWGVPAKMVEELIGGRALKLMSGHPSPQNRNNDFYGNDHFKLANEHLIANGRAPIDWQLSS